MEINQEIRKNLSDNFTKCIEGYHLINDEPIKESIWENINALTLTESGCIVTSQSNGSHKPGSDLSCSLGNLSNKTATYDSKNESFSVSSYRLTTVCGDKTPGNIEDIHAEITRRKNFNYYSILVRSEKDNAIHYDWYLIPSDYTKLNPSSYNWIPKVGKRGKKKGSTIGWETNKMEGSSMSIEFSMSSQLWIEIVITEEMKQFIIASCKVTKGKKLNYIQLYNKREQLI